MRKRLLSLFLAVVMVLGMLPKVTPTAEASSNYELKTLTFDQLWSDYLQPLLQEYVQGMYDESSIMNRFATAYGYVKPTEGDANETTEN